MADLELSGRTLGEFVLRDRIGGGGYGTVYRCEQPALARAAVVKVLHPRRRRNNAARERFLREARLASRLDHPYAAHVYSFGVEEDGILWIAMELVHGVTLSDWLRTRGPMPLDEFVPFFECIAEVVDAAHEGGIVHRDLKPSNIMVIESKGRRFPKLLDFGIAKLRDGADDLGEDEEDGESAADSVPTARIRVTPSRVPRTQTDEPRPSVGLTHPGAVLGSAPYMSPEQWGAPYAVGPSTDIYSLGCVAFETLTGRAPFAAANTREYYDRHLRAEPPALGDAFSPSLDRVLRKALAKSPEERHASALELASELRATLRAEPREVLRASAQQWHDRARPPGLLWGGDVLAEVERLTPAPSASLSALECSFVAESQRRARRGRWIRRSLVALAALGTIGVLQYRSAMRSRLAEEQARAAHELAEARIAESELEQGRAALLHGEPEALSHLAEAYRRAPLPTTAFMLARSIEPRLAERARFASTHGRMWWATFSPDGSQIATADDRAAEIRDARTHARLFTLPHDAEVYQALYSADGTRLVTVTQTTVKLWDARSGALLRELTGKPVDQASLDFFLIALSPDGRFVAATDPEGLVVHVWDARSGALVAELRNRATYPALEFSRGGYLATAGAEGGYVFDVRTWRRVLTIPVPVRALAFDAQDRLATGAASGDVALWEIPSGKRLRQLRPFGEPVEAITFSAEGDLVGAGGADGALQVWRSESGALRSQLNPRRSKIRWVEFDASSASLLAAHADGTVVVADVAQGMPIAVLEGPSNVMRVARFDPSARSIVGASWDGTARVWEATSPYRRWTSKPTSEDCGIVMGSEPDGRFIAVGCREHPTRVWDTARDRLLAELPSVTPIDGGGFTSAFPAVSSTGDRAAIARGPAVQVYELPSGRLLRTIDHGAPVGAVSFAPALRDLVSGAVDGSVRVTRDDGAELALRGPSGIDVAELLPDGRLVVSGADRHLRVYSAGGALLADLETPVRLMSLRRQGHRVVALPSYVTAAAPPLLIDLTSYRVVARLDGHVGLVFSARWVSGGRILTAGADGTTRLWDGETGRLLRTYRQSPRFLADATLTPDGMVIAGDADGVLRFWDAASGAKLWTLRAHKSAVIGVHLEGEDIVTRGFTGEVSRWRLPQSGSVIDSCAHYPPCAIVPR